MLLARDTTGIRLLDAKTEEIVLENWFKAQNLEADVFVLSCSGTERVNMILPQVRIEHLQCDADFLSSW